MAWAVRGSTPSAPSRIYPLQSMPTGDAASRTECADAHRALAAACAPMDGLRLRSDEARVALATHVGAYAACARGMRLRPATVLRDLRAVLVPVLGTDAATLSAVMQIAIDTYYGIATGGSRPQ